MTAIDKRLLDNVLIYEDAREMKARGFIEYNQFQDIKSKLALPSSSNNILIRFLFFLLGVLLFSSITGVISLVSSPIWSDGNFEILLLLFAITGVVGSEFLAKGKYYAHGLDDAFILGAQGCLYSVVGVSSENMLAVFAAMSVGGFCFCIRYVNSLSAVISVIGFTGLIENLVVEHHLISTAFLPFIMFFLGAGFYWCFTYGTRLREAMIYHNALFLIKIFSLLLIYFSMNYLVVRQLSEELLNVEVAVGENIPFAWLFYIFTFLIPLFFIVYALKKKDRAIFYIGILTFGFSIYTIRYYQSIMPIEYALTIGGLVLFAAVYLSIRLIRHKTTGITFVRDDYAREEALLLAQAFIVNSNTGFAATPASAESPMTFGGGGYSGGGAGESF
jgi:hypothetical protein